MVGGAKENVFSMNSFFSRSAKTTPSFATPAWRRATASSAELTSRRHRHPPPPKNVVKLLLNGRGGGVARFSDTTGELEVVNRKGKVLW